jgi:hypothetical protein
VGAIRRRSSNGAIRAADRRPADRRSSSSDARAWAHGERTSARGRAAIRR